VITNEKPSSLRFELRTSAGHASVDLPNASFQYNGHDYAIGSIGSGGPLVQLQSSAGSVSIGQ
jgi:hypothetical protein